MKVAFDVQNILTEAKTGIGYYTEQSIKALIDAQCSDEYMFNFFSLRGLDKKRSYLSDFIKDENNLNPCKWFSYSLYKVIYTFIPIPYCFFFPKKADIYYFFNYTVPPFVPGKAFVTVYDLVFKDYPETVNKKTKFFLKMNFKRSLKRADAIITISHFTKQRLLHFYGDIVKNKPIEVMYIGVDDKLFNRDNSNDDLNEIKTKHGIIGDYFLYVGTLEPRKNLERLVNAYALFCEKVKTPPQLVLGGGKGWLDEKILHVIKTTKGVVRTGYLPRDEIPKLMRGALAFCFPSLYEGFGMPVLEAMACGTPTLVSDRASLPEIVGDAGIIIKADDTNKIADALYQLYTDKALRNKLSEKGLKTAALFKWSRLIKTMTALQQSLYMVV